MVSRIAIALLALALTARAAIDFTPRPYELELEGVKFSQPGFRDGSTLVTFSPPAGWEVEGNGPSLRLWPREVSLASARVETRPLPAGSLDSEETLKGARQFLLSHLPPQAVDVKWETATERNPVLLNRHESLRLEATFSVLGQSFHATAVVAHLAEQQILFDLSARERDYPKLYEAWRRSLFTWQGLK